MLCTEPHAAPRHHAQHEREIRRPAHHEPELRRLVEDLVERDPGEVGELELHDGSQAGERRTDAAASNWPVSAPNTVIAAASRGSIAQAQNDIATMPKAKPDRPWTNPATAAPVITISKLESMETRRAPPLWGPDKASGQARDYARLCRACQQRRLLHRAKLIRCFFQDVMLLLPSADG